MSTINTQANTALTSAYLQDKFDKNAETSSEDVRNAKKSTHDNYDSFLSGNSHDRTIKLESSLSNITYSSQNSKMSSIHKQNSIDNDDKNIDASNVVNNLDKTNDSSIALSKQIQCPKIINPITKCSWLLGQLAWAKVGSFPFWPCVVTLDPEAMIYHKIRNSGRSHALMIHVHYFGDKGRHSWVTTNNMIHFTNLADFMKLSELLTREEKKKDLKYAAAFVVKQGIKLKWENAIEEAMEAQSLPIEERIKSFVPKVKDSKPKNTKSFANEEKNRNKRKYSNDEIGSDFKRVKQDDIHNVVLSEISKLHKSEAKPKNSRIVSGKIDSKLNPDTLDRDRENEDGVFEVYYERNRDLVEDEYPDASDRDIKRYLRKTWDSMDTTIQKKYRLYKTREKNPHLKESSSDHEDETLIEIDVSTKKSEKIKSKKMEKERNSVSEARRDKSYNLFKDMKQEKVCRICEKTSKLMMCKGPCYSYFHLSCVKPGESSPKHSIDDDVSDNRTLNNVIKKKINDENINNDKTEEQVDETFKCIDCLYGIAPACFICNKREEDRIRCVVPDCGKHYHSKCLKSWPQSHWQDECLTCPYHICHTCNSNNPQDDNSCASNEEIVRCVRCPSSYHASTLCLPAGSIVLTGSRIICPKHYKASQPSLNAAWCFLCTRGGSLICCDTCPISFHSECLGTEAPDGGFICEDCKTGRLPLYGEIVWVKFGRYRWWPSRICYPQEIPENVASIPYVPGEFCVMFLGSNDYYWMHRSRAFLYQDGDVNIKPPITKNKAMDDTYRKALQEANEIYLQLKAERSLTRKQKRLELP